MKLKPLAMVAAATCFVIVGVAITMATGLWQTESNKTPRTLKPKDGETANAQGSGTVYDPADIRGSYTFGEVSTLFGVPLTDIAEAFGLDMDAAAAFQVKALESLAPSDEVELGTASFRLFVAYYLGLPYAPSETVYLPESAAAVLLRGGKLTAERQAYLDGHTFP
jgi:hypothetical protein